MRAPCQFLGVLSRRAPVVAVVSAALCFSAIRFFVLVDRYSVNVLYWDQWDYYIALFAERGVWELFRLQHGPHRQGLGSLLSAFIAETSGWNTRAETFAIAVVLCLTAVAGLILKCRTIGPLEWTDVILPVLFLTPPQWEVFANTPNPAHGAVPLLLVILSCHAWTIRCRPLRYAVVLVLNFAAIHTGFGMLLGVITPLVLAADLVRDLGERDRKGLGMAVGGLAVAGLSAGIFFTGYVFDPAIEGFRFPDPEIYRYPQMMALAQFLPVRGIATETLVGMCLLTALVAVAIVHARGLFSSDEAQRHRSRIILILALSCVLFVANLAIGRVSLGSAAQFSRYVPLLLPGVLALYFHATTQAQTPPTRVAAWIITRF